MLTARANAVLKGDVAAFRATMEAAPAAFKRERLEWMHRIRTLPLGVYKLDYTQEEYSELTRATDREGRDGETHVIQVKERIGFRGYDIRPGAEDLYLTVSKVNGRWSVVADDDGDRIAVQSSRNLWDFGAVSHIAGDGIMVVFHPAERAAAPRILAMAKAARASVRRTWPIRWREDRIVIMIPSTVDELARILQTTFDLQTFVAFAASSVERSDGWRLTGPRVFLHWQNFRSYGATFQRTILQHEFLHLATREMSGSYVTAIMDEGVAQYYGEAAYNPPTPELRRQVRGGRFDGHLAEDFVFTVGPPDDIYSAYEQGNDFIAYIGERYGRNAGARLYRAIGAETAVSAGTWRYHLDRACRSVLDVSYATLEGAWARKVIRELA